MVISQSEKAILLERLQKARETKAAKAAATKAAKAKETPAAVKEPEPPAPAPVAVPPPAPEPAPEPMEKPAPSEPIDIPQIPDLVAMSRKKPAKKKKVESSSEDSDDSDAELPPKKGKGKSKKQAYMKIKIYKEPKNAVAFQSLVEAIQDEQPEDTEGHRPPTPPPASASIGRGCRFADANGKNAAVKKGTGVMTHQELMRRAALEFFS